MLTFADMGEGGVSEMLTSAIFILKVNEKLRTFAFNLDKYALIWLSNITNQFDRFQNTSSKGPDNVRSQPV